MKKVCLAFALLLLLSVTNIYGATYYWTGSTDYFWSTAANWSPVRSVGLQTDTMIFFADSTVRDTVVTHTTQTVAFIKVMPATNIWFQTASGKQILSINDSLVVGSGASLSVISPTSIADTLVLYLNANAKGSIDGTISFNYFSATTGPRHRLDAADSLAIQFNSGSTLVQNTFGNIFGGTGGVNRVIFNPGAQFIQYLGSNPFGLSAPNSKVLFNPGSWFRCRMNSTPSFSNRSYANFQLDWPAAAITGSGTYPFTVDTLLISDGKLSLQLRHMNIKGAVIVFDTLYFNSASTCSLYFNGSAQQTMDWSAANSFMLGAATNVFVDNSAGILLNSNLVVNCKLHLTNGNIVTGLNGVLLTTDSTIVRSNGYVQGTLWRVINTGTDVTKEYPVGNSDGYTPVNFTFSNVSTYGGVEVSVIQGTHPNANIPDNTMKNYWSVNPTGSLAFDTCNAVLGYRSSDFNTGLTEATDEESMSAGKYDAGSWAFPIIGTRDTTNNTIELMGITGFSDFALGKNETSFAPDTIPPYIISTYPVDGDSNIALDQAVMIVYSEPMDTNSIMGYSTPDMNFNPSWSATGDTLTLTPETLYVNNTTYTVCDTAGTDLVGNPIAGLPVSFSFTTVVGDTVSPTIAETSPVNGATEVALDAAIYIVFSEPMDTTSLMGSMTPGAKEEPTWSSTLDTMYLVHNPMELNTIYTIKLTAVTDLSGNSLAVLPDSFMFTTIVGDTVKPFITGTNPADGDSNVALDETVLFAFSEPINPSSFGGKSIPDFPFTPNWSANFDTLWLVPDTLYDFNTTYTLTCTTGTDMADNPLAVLPVSISFTTVVGDTVKPIVILTSPSNLDTDVALDAPVMIVFSEPMDTSVVNGNFLPDPGNVMASWSVTMDTLTLTHDLLVTSTLYTITIVTGTDLAGNPIAGLPDSFKFTTTPTGVEGKPGTQVYVLQLSPVAPNPMTAGRAAFKFSLPTATRATLEVFNVLGQKINTLVDGNLNAGNHTVNWNGTDKNGNKLTSGVYIYQLKIPGKTLTKRLTIIR